MGAHLEPKRPIEGLIFRLHIQMYYQLLLMRKSGKCQMSRQDLVIDKVFQQLKKYLYSFNSLKKWYLMTQKVGLIVYLFKDLTHFLISDQS